MLHLDLSPAEIGCFSMGEISPVQVELVSDLHMKKYISFVILHMKFAFLFVILHMKFEPSSLGLNPHLSQLNLKPKHDLT